MGYLRRGWKKKIFEKFLSTSNRLDFFSLLVFLMGKWRYPETNKPSNKDNKVVRSCAVVLIMSDSALKG